MPDVLPDGLATAGDLAASPRSHTDIIIAVPAWDRLDGATSAAAGLAARMRGLGLRCVVASRTRPRRSGAVELADAGQARLAVACMDTVDDCLWLADRTAVWLHGPSTWRWARSRAAEVCRWLVPSLLYPWETECPGWPPPGPVDELQPGFDPRRWTSAGREGRNGLLAVDACQQKGGATVLAVARALPDVQLTVVAGAGCNPHFRLYDLPNVRVLPQQEDMGRLYRQVLALVHPSPSETWGLVAAEAQACGCPVVCADTPVLRRTTGCDGLAEPRSMPAVLLPAGPGSEGRWIDAAAALVDDPVLWESVSQRGILATARWTDDDSFRRLAKCAT